MEVGASINEIFPPRFADILFFSVCECKLFNSMEGVELKVQNSCTEIKVQRKYLGGISNINTDGYFLFKKYLGFFLLK